MPHGALRAELEASWLDVQHLLGTRVSRQARNRLTIYAGQYSYYLGWLSFCMGDEETARGYLSIAEQHAAEVPDPLLVGSVAELGSGLAQYSGDFHAAADIAGQARHEGPHPYVRSMLAAGAARAAAMRGQPEAARAALAQMEAHVWAGPPLPGPPIFDEEAAHAHLSIVLGYLGDGEAAEAHAHCSLEILRGSGQAFAMAGTYNALARAFLHRRRPDPERAAGAATHALVIIQGRPSQPVIQAAADTWRRTKARWPELAAVRDLGELVVSARKVLPAGGVA